MRRRRNFRSGRSRARGEEEEDKVKEEEERSLSTILSRRPREEGAVTPNGA